MNRRLLQKLSILRINEAQTLFTNRNYSGAYYLAGYAIECALKACIARKTKVHEFPDKSFAVKCYTHDLGNLVRLADLELHRASLAKQNPSFELNWTTVKDWAETSRYSLVNKIKAQELISSITEPANGVLQWLQHHW